MLNAKCPVLNALHPRNLRNNLSISSRSAKNSQLGTPRLWRTVTAGKAGGYVMFGCGFAALGHLMSLSPLRFVVIISVPSGPSAADASYPGNAGYVIAGLRVCVARTRAKAVSVWAPAERWVMICRTGIPRMTSASAINLR